MASSPSSSQDPSNASWRHPFSHHRTGGGSSNNDSHSHHNHIIHIATPHPLAAATEFLDKHVPLFAKHRAEFSTGHNLRAAKHEARRSVIDTPIPEVDAEHLHHHHGGAVEVAMKAATATGAAPALADGEASWNAVLSQREAVRLTSARSTADAESVHTVSTLASPLEKSSGSSPASTP